MQRVSKSAPAYTGEYQALHYAPEITSTQDYVMGVAVSSQGHVDAWRVLSDYRKLECIYGKDYISANQLNMLFASAVSLLNHARTERKPLPDLGTMSPHLRWGAALYASGDSAQEAADGIYQSIVSLEPGAKLARPFESKDTETVRREVNVALKKKLGLRYERCVEERGYIEVTDGKTKHRLDINLKSGKACGTVISAWYAQADSVKLQTLQAASHLETAQTIFRLNGAGIFVRRPANTEGIPEKALVQIDNQIDEAAWRAKKCGQRFAVEEKTEALAEEIAEFI